METLSTYVIYMLNICQRQSADLHPHDCHCPSDAASPISWRSPLVKPDLAALCFNADIVVPRLASVRTSARLPLVSPP